MGQEIDLCLKCGSRKTWIPQNKEKQPFQILKKLQHLIQQQIN